jgi:hypothetical protein
MLKTHPNAGVSSSPIIGTAIYIKLLNTDSVSEILYSANN